MAIQNHRVSLDAETAARELAELVAAVQQAARAQRDGDQLGLMAAARRAETTSQRLTDRLVADATAEQSVSRRGVAETLGLPSHGVLQHRINRHHQRHTDQED